MKKMLFIYNPMAGKEQIKNKLSDIIREFCAGGFEVTIYATQAQQDATKLVIEKGEECDYVVCSGGDGTMNEVAAGLMQLEKKPVCGYIPAGTVNDFASTLKIPRIMKKAAHLITEENVFLCDLGQLNERYFTYVAGFGAFTEVSYQTPQELKKALGKTAYFIEALKHIADIKTHHMKLSYDGGTVEDNFIVGLVSNSISVAGYNAYSRMNIKMDDGLFEVLLIREMRNPLQLQETLTALVSKSFDAERILQFSTSQLHIVSDDKLQWTLDGEDGGMYSDILLTNHKQAMPIICDKRALKGISGTEIHE